MRTLSDQMKEEHRQLLWHLESVRTAADVVGETSPDWARSRVADAQDFLTRRLMPHAEAEEEVLFPAIAGIGGAAAGSMAVGLDHIEIARLVGELDELMLEWGEGALQPWVARELRRVLYGLYEIARYHLTREQEEVLPLLEATMTVEAGRDLFEALYESERELRSV